ncbi:chitosanase [Streptomyces spiroverticillatus]|uniref:Chitosanase n=1 Tax=Streptomyces finlayi TaxID=67296 RepID=A0A919C8H3_9ACTN|nr:chitosanase [Streptomyces finlayi]GHA01790.1 chitosanase [Streptomyces spiroverticillatus]GHC86097.1 chitosanase [Streptomyces finlayi]
MSVTRRVQNTVRALLGLTLAAVPGTAVAAGAPEADDPGTSAASGLRDPAKKELAMRLVSSAENSSLEWKKQYRYIEDIGDGRGYTAGIIGFCSGTGDMLELVEHYSAAKPGNVLEKYLPALRKVNGSDSHRGLGSGFVRDWEKAADDRDFREAQNHERDRVYFEPAVRRAERDGLGTLGQFVYYDAMVMHGAGGPDGFDAIRRAALERAASPARGGDQGAYLHAFLDVRKKTMKREAAHEDTSRIDSAQRLFLREGNFELRTPLAWQVYGDSYRVD